MRLIALEACARQIDAGEAEAVARELYGLSARARPLDGERDRNFLLETPGAPRLVLKFIDPGLDEAIMDAQCAVLAHLAEQAPELPVPRLVPSRDGRTCAALSVRGGSTRVRLITHLPGRLVSTLTTTPALLHALGNEIARMDLALRGFYHPALAQPLAWDIRRATALLPLVPDIDSIKLRRLVATALEPLPSLLPRLRGLRAQAIHNDCHPRNLLADEQAERCTGIIDLGDMIHAPLVFEPAVAMAEFLNDRPGALDQLDAILQGYAEIQQLESADVQVLYPLIGARIALGALILRYRRRSAGKLMDGQLSDPDSARLEQLTTDALESLAVAGRDQLTRRWQEIAATGARSLIAPPGKTGPAADPDQTLLHRRREVLGSHAELSYERPLHLVRGDGVWVYTAGGERLLDVYNNVPHVGHAHPAVVAAIAGQASRIASNTRYLDQRILDYSERLLATLPDGLDTCLFVNSGSEANDVAWRLARHHTGRGGALVMTHAYHGITEAVTALSPATTRGKSPRHVQQLAAPPTVGAAAGTATGATTSAATNTGATTAARSATDAAADVQAAIGRLAIHGFEPAALLIDSALTSTGIFDPPAAWGESIAAAVRAAGALLIADEVQYGLGRSGSHFWGFERRGYIPDIVTLGKPVANGYPLGIVVTRRALLESFQQETGFFSTFGGNPVACAAGLAVLQVLESERLIENARLTGDYFTGRLRALTQRYAAMGEVRGCGLLIGIEVTARPGRPAAHLTRQVVNGLRDRGVLIGSEGPGANVLKLRPPMPFRPQHADVVVDRLVEALRSADRS